MYYMHNAVKILTVTTRTAWTPGFRKTRVFKQPNGFWGFIGFWALLGFLVFYLSRQLGSLLVDLAHQLSFYLDLPGLQII